MWWCQGFSEPEAGSDLASLRTTAVRDGDEYVVNGQKTWTTLAQYADWIFCLVRTNPDAPKRQAGISFLLIDMATPGVTVRPIKLIDGGYEVNEVWLEDVRVPVANLVGERERGLELRQVPARQRAGRRGPDRAVEGHARPGQAAGRADPDRRAASLLDDPLFAARLAELETELLALELTQLRVVANSADGKPSPGVVGAEAAGFRAAAGGDRAPRRGGRAGLGAVRGGRHQLARRGPSRPCRST